MIADRLARVNLTPHRLLVLIVIAALLGVGGITIGLKANAHAATVAAGIAAQNAAERVAAEQKAQQAAQLGVFVCAIADSQRSGNTDLSPATTERGQQVGAIWQGFWTAAHCSALPRLTFDPRTGLPQVPRIVLPIPSPTEGPR